VRTYSFVVVRRIQAAFLAKCQRSSYEICSNEDREPHKASGYVRRDHYWWMTGSVQVWIAFQHLRLGQVLITGWACRVPGENLVGARYCPLQHIRQGRKPSSSPQKISDNEGGLAAWLISRKDPREQVVTTALPCFATYVLHLRLLHRSSFSETDIAANRSSGQDVRGVNQKRKKGRRRGNREGRTAERKGSFG